MHSERSVVPGKLRYRTARGIEGVEERPAGGGTRRGNVYRESCLLVQRYPFRMSHLIAIRSDDRAFQSLEF